jgi:anti-sigma B factor antagonist
MTETLQFEMSPENLAEAVHTVGATRRTVSKVQVVVAFAGELDLFNRRLAYDACVAGTNRDVVVDLSAVSFMDCAGYGALIAARSVLLGRSGSLTFRNARDEPARLLLLIGHGQHDVRAASASDHTSFEMFTEGTSPMLPPSYLRSA